MDSTFRWILQGFLSVLFLVMPFALQAEVITDTDWLKIPQVGATKLTVLSSNILELTLITTKAPDPATVTEWNFVNSAGVLSLPAASNLTVLVNNQEAGKQVVGFKRRPLYAPLSIRDLRIGNYLYLQLAQPLSGGARVEVLNPSGTLFPPERIFAATNDALRLSPAIHVNQAGYAPGLAKKGSVGYYLGSAGELPIPATNGFQIIPLGGTNILFQASLVRRPDFGYTYATLPYQQVYEADFTSFDIPGEYRLRVPNLGVSLPFRIHTNAMGLVPRTYALGLYHQRCGTSNSVPFTRHTHPPCHTAAAEIPTMAYQMVNHVLAQESADYASNPRHTAPQLKDVSSSLYPFVRTNTVDVSGGHHDAGDYSKYTINSAQLIHALVFAADVFPAIRQLDNLGLPESGDGISDVLQIARREAAFLAKMQDSDGGFYFLVYPRDRRYEHDVLPDRGDPQVVFPKTTAATAAATAALAQIADSPTFKQHYPSEAANYLDSAKRGWTFLENAIDEHGRDGAYQKITHYGNTFMHDDELAWAATELYLATGLKKYHDDLLEHFDPSDPNTLHWGWWRLYEGYGCAIRSYAFAAALGRQPANKLNSSFLTKCRTQILAAADDQLLYSQSNAYGVSFPLPSKQYRVAGWFFATAQAFDLLAGYKLDPKPEYLDAMLANIAYECGNNPLNLSYVTGTGWKRQREIVNQYAQNDRRAIPPSGIPVGAIQEGFTYLGTYGDELEDLVFPSDDAPDAAYAFYDRWGDTFNTLTESVAPQQARGLVTAAFLWSNGTNQSWRSAEATIPELPVQSDINNAVTLTLTAAGFDLTNALIVWEAREQEPFLGPVYSFTPTNIGPYWVEAEALLPDGRRLIATNQVVVPYPAALPPNDFQPSALSVHPEMAALYHVDLDGTDATANQLPLEFFGNTTFDTSNVGWMNARMGAALRFEEIGDYALAHLTNSSLYNANTRAIVLEAMIYVANYRSAATNLPLVTLVRNWDASLELFRNPYFGLTFRGGTQFEVSGVAVSNALPRNSWNHLRLAINESGYDVRINGRAFAFQPSDELNNWADPRGYSTLVLGNFEGWIDEVVVWNVTTNHQIALSARQLSADEMALRLLGDIGTYYRLQTSTNLLDWNTVAINVLATNPTEIVYPIDNGQQFFRTPPLP